MISLMMSVFDVIMTQTIKVPEVANVAINVELWVHTHARIHTQSLHTHTHYTYIQLHTYNYTHTHNYTHTYTLHYSHTLHYIQTHTHKAKQSKAKSLAAAKRSRQPSEPALGCLGTTQALRAKC